MKTARLDVYEIFGTSNIQADILYRGEVLHSVNKMNVPAIEANKEGIVHNAILWATNRGFIVR